MRSRLFLLPATAGLALAASAPAQVQGPPLDRALAAARAEQAAAEARLARLERAASDARGEAARLRAEQKAAGQAIDAAEARITAADTSYRLATAEVAAQRRRLVEEQRPASALLGGLAMMARQPPLAALAGNGGGPDEFVKVSLLLDSTLPAIRRRTSRLSDQLARAEQLEKAASAARAELGSSRRLLDQRRKRFAELEQRALERSLLAGEEALGVGDVALAAGEQAERLERAEAGRTSALALAALLAAQPPAPQAPATGRPAAPAEALRYALPVRAPVTDGLGDVSDSGVRSRGIRFATERGAPVTAPADGRVRFSGPFRDYDGILIIDHGDGWISLLVNLATPLRPGDRVRLGDPVGRALGPLEVQLIRGSRRFSPALIAGSSAGLSKAKDRG